MSATSLSAPLLAAINHVLDQSPWAKQRLQPFAGQTIRIDMPPFAPCFAISSGGQLQAIDASGKPADLKIVLPANTPLLAMQGSNAVIKAAQINGPADLADAFSFVLRNLRWDLEEDLSKAFGDVAAYRLVSMLKIRGGRMRHAAQNFTENISEYLIDEKRMLVKSAEFSGFANEVEEISKCLGKIENTLHLLKETHK